MKRTFLLFCCITLASSGSFGQAIGEGVFNFLQLTNSAKAAALGGIQIALPDADPELILQNPSLLSAEMDNTLSVNYVSYLAGIGYGFGAYARSLGKYGTAAIGIQYVDYGKFTAADDVGTITGTFNASDYALVLAYAKPIGNRFSVGASIKPIYSHLEIYQSFGVAADLGITHLSASKLTSIALCVRNLGTQLSGYYGGGVREKMDWSVQLGCTRQLQFAPLRFSVTAYDLNKWGTSAQISNPDGTQSTLRSKGTAADIMRHVVVGAELFPQKKITFRVGYNYRRHADLALDDQTGFVGFSAGLGIRLPAIRLNYALSGYHLTGTVHHFSLSANLAQILR